MDDFRIYRIAGEFFGRVKNELHFGELSLTNGFACFTLHWKITINKNKYMQEYSVGHAELEFAEQANAIVPLASKIANVMRADAKRIG
jgi:hypothetical protein